uniref:Uncharacterized protein n=1 Tax=Molossus molossus TaxID=27622 RepID=A0A7J8HGW0_MOLMO|nr:hypothetical protein HJG59_010924 [Molossus molossus]
MACSLYVLPGEERADSRASLPIRHSSPQRGPTHGLIRPQLLPQGPIPNTVTLGVTAPTCGLGGTLRSSPWCGLPSPGAVDSRGRAVLRSRPSCALKASSSPPGSAQWAEDQPQGHISSKRQ